MRRAARSQRARPTRPFVSASGASVEGKAPPWGCTCRVCGVGISEGEPVLRRPWCAEYAHVACGYLREEEKQPNEFHYPERFGAYWQWACPCCGRDVVATDKRDELRCKECRGNAAA
jgi:hypothetical protein